MKKVILTAGFVLIFLTACSTEPKPIIDADVVIAKDTLSAKALFIPAEVGGTKLEIIAVNAPDGTIRTAFNTCQVCYDSGRGFYKQDGNVLVCQNCGNRFKMSQVEVESGGCNPVPIWDEWTDETDDSITIPLELLQEASQIFSNWKTE
ncbi:membrane protein [Clostridia bacterium]|nr:membrane protein [Clostridia bacterium]GHV35587.1 membrane protein [Clostridia bacterium]